MCGRVSANVMAPMVCLRGLPLKEAPKHSGDVPPSVNNQQDENSIVERAVPDNGVANRKAASIFPEIRTAVAHQRLPGVLLALGLNGIEKTQSRLALVLTGGKLLIEELLQFGRISLYHNLILPR